VEDSEMHRTFNCGIGMVLVLAEEDVSNAIELLQQAGETAWKLGEVVSSTGEPEVIIE